MIQCIWYRQKTASRIAGSGMLLICYSELLVTSVHSDGSWWVCCLAGWSGSGPLPSAYGVTQLQEFDLGALPYAMDLVHCSRLQARRVHSTLGQIASARATSHIQYFSACCSPLIYFLFGKIWYESRTKSVLRHLGRPSQYYFGNSSFCPIFILPAVCMGCWISPWPPCTLPVTCPWLPSPIMIGSVADPHLPHIRGPASDFSIWALDKSWYGKRGQRFNVWNISC